MATKIAFLSPTPIYNGDSGWSGIRKDLIITLNSAKRKKLEVVVFSFGDRNSTISKKFYKEIVFKNNGFIGNKNILVKFAEYLSLLFGYSYTYFERSHSEKFNDALSSFTPDIIIASYESIDNAVKCRKGLNKNVKIVCLTDDLNQISQYMNSIKSKVAKNNFIIKTVYNIGLITIGNRFTSFLKGKYETMLECSDCVVLFTGKGVEISKKAYPRYADRFVSIPPPIITRRLFEKVHVSRKVKKILFLGVCGYPPNDDAIRKIKTDIAPALGDMKFILAGRDCKVYKYGNVESVGFVKNIDQFIRSVDICIAPVFYGGGIKTKVLSYFAAGKPVIATSVALEGFPVKNGFDAIVVDDIEGYPRAIRDLSENRKSRRKISENAIKLASGFSNTKVGIKWLQLLDKLTNR